MPAPLPPLSLYVHLPWCVRKCPYCDFNSHALRGELAEDAYVDALLRDLAQAATLAGDREVRTIFIGGGTPSLFHPSSIARLLAGIGDRVPLAAAAEITLEANPGTVELDRFRGFREAGVNRLSIGIQSFEEGKLRALGRIHGPEEARRAAEAAGAAGFRNLNLDLMYGLPGQTAGQALADIEIALAYGPAHLSAYQLTLEPHTYFHAHPPPLPDDEAVASMHQAIEERLRDAGYRHYEVSAYARHGSKCRHNLNYWEFGDYLGIGAGAHAKITGAGGTWRYANARHPAAYMRHAGTDAARASTQRLEEPDLVFEFMLNALRLHAGFAPALFEERTGLPFDRLDRGLETGRRRGLIEPGTDRVVPSELGRRFLNDLLLLFVPDRSSPAATAVI